METVIASEARRSGQVHPVIQNIETIRLFSKIKPRSPQSSYLLLRDDGKSNLKFAQPGGPGIIAKLIVLYFPLVKNLPAAWQATF